MRNKRKILNHQTATWLDGTVRVNPQVKEINSESNDHGKKAELKQSRETPEG